MNDDEPGVQTPVPGGNPRFLAVFDALRSRPARRHHTLLARMERRVARRVPAEKHDGLQRGDGAEPPPVLDLAVSRAGDRSEVVRMLVERGGTDLVWRLPETEPTAEEVSAGPAREPRGSGAVERPGKHRLTQDTPVGNTGEQPDQNAPVTTDQLYDLLEHLVDDSRARLVGRPGPPRHRKPPPPPRFTRLHSLLWLRRCRLATVQVNVSGSEVAQEHAALHSDSRTQAEVVNELRRVRLESARARHARLLGPDTERASGTGGGDAPADASPWWERSRTLHTVHWRRLAFFTSRLSRWVMIGLSDTATFGWLNERVLTPLAYVVSLVVAFTPFALLGLVAQQINNLVGLFVGVGLSAAYAVVAFFIVLPWRPYRWLKRHRYVTHSSGNDTALTNHRDRGIHVLNQINDPACTGRVSADTRPPGVHRLAVNAFLDGLHRSYGSAGRWRRKRGQRPVLLLEQERLGPVARYLVLLIEDERLRRGFPDPLLIVQVRATRASPLVRGHVATDRYPSLPEGEGAWSPSPEAARWTRTRHAAGTLGTTRLIHQEIGPLPLAWRERSWRAEPVWVLTAPALTARWATGSAACVALVLVMAWLVVPELHPCVQRGLAVPSGVDTRREAEGRQFQCVGVTFGDFVFHERLEEVTTLIRNENRDVDESGGPYVTIAYIGELWVSDPDDPSLSGPQGELLGLAFQQDEHNTLVGNEGEPRIKLLIGNAGERWGHADETAREVVARAANTFLGMDRPIGVVGFGHSTEPSSEAIQIIGDARLPMVGTTATHDDVAQYSESRQDEQGDEEPRYGVRRHNEYFFPVAPANSRIAEQAARWAYRGVRWQDEDGSEHGLKPAGTAVAIAGDDGEHDRYGPHLAEKFMAAFEAEKNHLREGAQEPETITDGTLLYDSRADLGEHLDRLCTDEPPDLIYFAGRSADFETFLKRVQRAEGDACARGEMSILAGDDIAKFATDRADDIGQFPKHPVFYTPLAASGPWGESRGARDEQGFYTQVDRLIACLYVEDWDGEGECSPDAIAGTAGAGLPSIAHAAVASDALLVVSRALPHSGLTPEELSANGPLRLVGLDRSRFMRTQEDYEDTRDLFFGGVQATRGLAGMSGSIEFDLSVDGHWFAERLVQLVLVGPRSGGERQHVIGQCGMGGADQFPVDDCV